MDKGMIFKDGTSLYGAHPEIRRAIWIAKEVLNSFGYRCVITSLWDGFHSENSFHHYGMAVDLRSNEVRTLGEKNRIGERIQLQLGRGFDVILEGVNTPNEHFHIEWEHGRPMRDEWVREVFLGKGSALPEMKEPEKKKPWYRKIF